MQQRFFDLLREENKKGATILFSSHILSEVQKLCDRVAIIKDGSIVRVDKIKTLSENTHKRFKLETATKVEKGRFTGINGISDLVIKDNTVSFLFRGKINEITKVIASLNLTNMIVEEPDLEDIFMHYYV